MAGKSENLPLVMRIHNMTCPAWILRIGFLRKIEPGCRMVQKRLSQA